MYSSFTEYNNHLQINSTETNTLFEWEYIQEHNHHYCSFILKSFCGFLGKSDTYSKGSNNSNPYQTKKPILIQTLYQPHPIPIIKIV